VRAEEVGNWKVDGSEISRYSGCGCWLGWGGGALGWVGIIGCGWAERRGALVVNRGNGCGCVSWPG
jgi:hypothetical protein